MKILFTIELSILLALGFVPNQRNQRYHTAHVTIGGHTVWCKNIHDALKVGHRATSALYRRGLDVQYRVEDRSGNYEYNW